MEIYLYILPIVLAGILQGGYFVYASAILSTGMFIGIIVNILKKKKLYLTLDMNFLIILIVCLMYFIVTIWGIDRGMSLMGGIKFLPLLLYFIIVSGHINKKEIMIEMLPMLGTCMTIFSFLMMQFPVFEKTVSVAGRLSGFFQYPNTYALFMLICLIIAISKINIKKIDWIWCLYTFVSIFGIVMSGSRTILLLMIILAIIFCIIKSKVSKKLLLAIITSSILLIFILWITGFGKEVIIRLLNTNGSTFWGRLLYMKDAINMILDHPFGLGYYGYHYIQTSYQTGVYSLVNVHNELLQLMLDIGVIPAILFYGMLIRSCLSKKTNFRNKIILGIIILHSLFDYDFQFLVIAMVTILFLNTGDLKEISISWLTKTFTLAVSIGIIILSGITGLSDFYYLQDMTDKSLKIYTGNTEARIELLQKANSTKKMEKIANKIIDNNQYVSIAYSASAQVCFAKGNMEGYIKNKLIAIQLAPYQYNEYEDYLKTLAYAEGEYLKNDDIESAKECVKRAKSIPSLLNNVKLNTSSLGWKINDTPKVLLSHENLELIKEMESKINE